MTAFFGLLLLATLLGLAFEVLPKAVLSLVVAGVALFAAVAWGVDFGGGGHGGHHIPMPVHLIEWPTLGVIIGSSIFVEIASRSGIFTWSAIRLLKASRGDPWRLLLLLGVLTLAFSAFLNNVTAMIIVGSLTVVACRSLGLQARSFLLVEAFLTNVGGLLTLISSLPNIILGHAAGIGFLRFFLVAAPYCLIASAATFVIARRTFGIRPLTDPVILWYNTGILVLASIAYHWTRNAAVNGVAERLKPGLMLSGALTFAFLIGQLIAWQQINDAGYYVTGNPSYAFFYLLTAVHALHMLGGLWVWGRSTYKVWTGAEADSVRLAIELCTVYWHFLLLVWVVLFGLLLST